MYDTEKYTPWLLDELPKAEQHKLIKEYKQTGDIEARNKLIAHNLRLCMSTIVNRFPNLPFEFDDAFQISSIALVKAIENFDESKNCEFSTYAVTCINNELLKEINRVNNLVKAMSLNEIRIPPEHDNHDYEGKELMEYIQDEDESYISFNYQTKEFKEELASFIETSFTEKEKFVYNALVGKGYSRPQSLCEIASRLGVAHPSVIYIKNNFARKLKIHLSKFYPEQLP